MSNMGRVGGMFARKNSNHWRKRSLLIQPLALLVKSVYATAPSRNLAGGVCLRGITIIGGKTWPDAEAHVNAVCVFPFSADVTAYTLWRPISATTIPGLWTTLTPVSSQLYICISLDIRFTSLFHGLGQTPCLPFVSNKTPIAPSSASVSTVAGPGLLPGITEPLTQHTSLTFQTVHCTV